MMTVASVKSRRPAPTTPEKTPIFDALIMQAQQPPPAELMDTAAVARELGISEEEMAVARARVAQWAPDEPEPAADSSLAAR